MSDYTKTTNFTAKDALTTGDPLKVIKGSYFDTEFDNIATAVATKYDSGDLASQAQAEAETANTVLMTPLRVANWADANAGAVGDLQALADPAANRIAFWDNSATALAWLTVNEGLSITGTNLNLSSSVAGDGLTNTAGVLDVVGNNGLTAAANSIGLTDAAASTTNPIDVASGAITVDLTALTTMEGNALAATDVFLVDDAGTPKGILYRDMGLSIKTAQTTQTLAAGDMNNIMEFNGTATLTLPLNATTALPIGSGVIIVVDHASQVVTVTADTGVTLNSVNHPGGGSAASDTVLSGGMAVLIKTEANEWYLSGDIAD